MSRSIAPLAAVLVLSAAAACDKVPLLAPTASTITLTINTTTLPVNGTATVVASVTEQAGTPAQNGTVVTFTASFGTIEPAEARTEGGKATVTFRAGSQSGVAKVGAFSGATRATEVEVRIGGAAAERVSLRAEPATVPQTGGTVQLIAIVTDASGNALPGAPVVFSADNGTLGNSSGVSDANGEVRTTLSTNRETVVSANVAGKEGKVTVRIVNLPTVTIASSGSAAVGMPVSFTVTPGTTAGGTAISGVTVDFGDGSQPTSLGAISGATGVSHVFDREGSYTVTATVTDISGQRNTASTVVTVQRNLPTVTITPSASTVASGSAVTFTINSTAATGGPPIASVRVSFPDGTSLSIGPGQQTITRTFTIAGTYIVRAVATDQAGTSVEATTVIIVTSPGALDITISVPSYIPGGGSPTTPSPACTGTSTLCSVILPSGSSPSVTVSFEASSPTGLVTNEVVTQYAWSFGNGSSTTTTVRRTDSVYTASGTYTVSVTATTSLGRTVTGRLTLVVQTAAPFELTFNTSNIRFVGSGGTPASATCQGTLCSTTAGTSKPVTVLFEVNSPTLLSGETVTSYVWDFGDGTAHATTTDRTTSHAYSTAGTYAVTATATTTLGRTAIARLTLIVQ